jgi:hypothetical protein
MRVFWPNQKLIFNDLGMRSHNRASHAAAGAGCNPELYVRSEVVDPVHPQEKPVPLHLADRECKEVVSVVGVTALLRETGDQQPPPGGDRRQIKARKLHDLSPAAQGTSS